MRKPKQFRVYIMTNRSCSHVLYTGVTGNLPRLSTQEQTRSWFYQPLQPHPSGLLRVLRLSRRRHRSRKKIKGWRRGKKIRLIESVSPHWYDLAESWTDVYKPVERTGLIHPTPDPSLG